MKKHIANIITGSRILLSLPLLFMPLSSVRFFVLYLFCGLTDMIDGTVARRTGAVSPFGAKLDSAADLVFFVVSSIKILPPLSIPAWLWVWIIAVGGVKTLLISYVLIHRKKPVSIHSLCNKATGLSLFLLPLTLIFVEAAYSITAVCALATVAAAQEVYGVATGKEIVP